MKKNQTKSLNLKARKAFKKKYSDEDSVVGFKLNSGSLIKTSPGDKNVSPHFELPGKKAIEKVEAEKRADFYRGYILDAVEIRKLEILNKKDVPMVKLLELATRNIPQKTESKNEHTFTFADMVKRATLNVNKEDVVDAEIVG